MWKPVVNEIKERRTKVHAADVKLKGSKCFRRQRAGNEKGRTSESTLAGAVSADENRKRSHIDRGRGSERLEVLKSETRESHNSISERDVNPDRSCKDVVGGRVVPEPWCGNSDVFQPSGSRRSMAFSPRSLPHCVRTDAHPRPTKNLAIAPGRFAVASAPWLRDRSRTGQRVACEPCARPTRG